MPPVLTFRHFCLFYSQSVVLHDSQNEAVMSHRASYLQARHCWLVFGRFPFESRVGLQLHYQVFVVLHSFSKYLILGCNRLRPSPFQFIICCHRSSLFDPITVSFVCTPARPSVRPRVTALLPLDGFTWNLAFECFSKIIGKIRFIKMEQE
jgi:hypothetical protein